MIQEYSLLIHQYDAAMKLKFVKVKHFLYFELFDSMSDSLEQLSRKQYLCMVEIYGNKMSTKRDIFHTHCTWVGMGHLLV